MKIIDRIKNEIKACEETQDTFPDFANSQPFCIELIDLYWNSKFRDGDTDDSGYKKFFYNIVQNPTYIAAKMIDLDTKHIRIIAEDGQSYYPAWFFQHELNLWMKETKFGELLNKMVLNYPKYGTIVLKKTATEISLVPLQNLYIRPTAESLEKSDFVIEKHEYLPEQLLQMPWDRNAILEAIDKAEDQYITVYERYGECDENCEFNYYIVSKEGIVLYQDRLDFLPYKELHWDKISGRWMGRGTVENLFEAQIAKNQNENLLRKGLRWTSKHIFQSRDKTIASNLMTDVDDGDLMIVRSEITPIAVEERNLHVYREEDTKWNDLIQRLSFAYEPISGEQLPTRMPLGVAQISVAMAGRFFDLKREELGMFIKEILYDWVLSEFKKIIRKPHKVVLGEFDEERINIIRKLIFKNRWNKALIRFFIKNERFPDRNEQEQLKNIIREAIKNEKTIDIPKDYYDDLKYKVKIIVTGEEIDIGAKMTTLQAILTMIATNPTILRDPRTRKIFFKLIDLAGISPTEFKVEEEMEEELPIRAERGGGIALPTPMPTPTRITRTPTAL